MSRKAVVIGAGPAGLTAAYELAKHGVGSVILEADRQVGGLSRTVNYGGFRFDIGGHRFFSKVALINDLWREMLGEDFLLRPRLSRIHYGGDFFDYPLRAGNALARLGALEACRVGLSYAKARAFPSRVEANFEQWVANRFGYRLYEIFFKTYTEKVWGIPCSEISADWAAQRIKNLSLIEAVRNALFRSNGTSRDGKVITTLIDRFHYPRHGPGMMWERCESLLSKGGNETVRGVKVERIRHRNGRVECVYARTAGGDVLETAGDHFISTMPLRSLIRAMDPVVPDEVRKAAEGLRYRDYLTVVLIVDRPEVFPDNWIYIHSPSVKMGRIQNYKNWSPEMVPDQSKTSLGLEYFLWDRDDEWSWSDERLIELGVRECSELGLIEPSEVEDGTVVRMKKAYPVYDHQYAACVKTIRRYLDGFENLQTVGRNGQHRYNNQDHSMLTGVFAARNIAGERYDVWNVNVEQEYHEAGVVEESSQGTGRSAPQRVETEGAKEAHAADKVLEAVFARLDPVSLGGAVGVVCGLVLFSITAILLFKGGDPVGPTLSLLGQYLPGFTVTWGGAFVGLVEAAIGGFLVGCWTAGLRNGTLTAYARYARRKAEAKERGQLLERV